MKQFKTFLVIFLSLTLFLVGCGGGGGGSTSTGGEYYTHDELAAEFVRRVNVDVTGMDLELVKSTTLQYDYIVVYDWNYGTYDAYDLGNYNVGENLYDFLSYNNTSFYYDLIPLDGNVYEDYWTGIQFDESKASTKDLRLVKAVKEKHIVSKAAKVMQSEYGLSEERSLEWAKAAYLMSATPKKNITKSFVDSVSQELVGSSYSEIKKDLESNNASSLSSRIADAGELNGLSATQAAKLMETLIK